jgi:hypothetical protein
MPAVAPREEDWVPDTKAAVCMVCKLERFSMVRFFFFKFVMLYCPASSRPTQSWCASWSDLVW